MGMVKEDAILLAGVEDRIHRCLDKDVASSTAFLDARQRSLTERLCRSFPGLKYYFSGGYENAERTIGIFLPDYAEPGDLTPLTLLRITQNSNRELGHRDYLGSLTALGVKREMVGDILVHQDGADIIIKNEIANFLVNYYEKAGRVSLQGELLPIESIRIPEKRVEEKKDTVASLRLDNIISSAFSISRGRAAEAIHSGMVFINGLVCDKTDRLIKEGDKLVLRGQGKAILKSVGGPTRKDRIFIVIERYL
jgi:RNA-binding protein YlmH